MTKLDNDVIEQTAQEFAKLALTVKGDPDVLEAFYTKDLLLSGERAQIIELVMTRLTEGTASPGLQRIGAALYFMETQTGVRGRKPIARPRRWLHIGESYVELKKVQTWDEAILTLMSEFHMGKTSVEESVRFYLKVMQRVKALTGIDTLDGLGK